jgi:hypothetical protein
MHAMIIVIQPEYSKQTSKTETVSHHRPLLVEANLPNFVGVVFSFIISSITCFNLMFFSSAFARSYSSLDRAFSFWSTSDFRDMISRSRLRSVRDLSSSSRSRSCSSSSSYTVRIEQLGDYILNALGEEITLP